VSTALEMGGVVSTAWDDLLPLTGSIFAVHQFHLSVKWESEANAEPKTLASGFLEGSAPALPKFFGTSGDVPSRFVNLLEQAALL
jgi:hypothetical protein